MRSMVVADTLFAFGVLGWIWVFHFARGPGDEYALVADLASSCIKTDSQSCKVRFHVYILDENKSQDNLIDGKITTLPKDAKYTTREA